MIKTILVLALTFFVSITWAKELAIIPQEHITIILTDVKCPDSNANLTYAIEDGEFVAAGCYEYSKITGIITIFWQNDHESFYELGQVVPIMSRVVIPGEV